jgi:hypothetical protein
MSGAQKRPGLAGFSMGNLLCRGPNQRLPISWPACLFINPAGALTGFQRRSHIIQAHAA